MREAEGEEEAGKGDARGTKQRGGTTAARKEQGRAAQEGRQKEDSETKPNENTTVSGHKQQRQQQERGAMAECMKRVKRERADLPFPPASATLAPTTHTHTHTYEGGQRRNKRTREPDSAAWGTCDAQRRTKETPKAEGVEKDKRKTQCTVVRTPACGAWNTANHTFGG
jgi:hypothetical protein